MKYVDYAVIGAGAGGLTTSIGLAKLGKNVLLIEKGEMGGDCTNVGCVPSKALIHLAKETKKSGQKISLREAMKIVRAKRQNYRDHEAPEVLQKKYSLEVMLGAASFKDKKTLLVGDMEVHVKKKIIIATGSHAILPTIDGLDEKDALTNEHIFEIDQDLKNLVVIGGGYIGCELGEAFANLGVNVTIIQRNIRLIPREEKEASELIQKRLEEAGITVLTGCTGKQVVNGKLVVGNSKGESQELEYDKILFATGRKANTNSLNLSAAGIKSDKSGIIVDQFNRTNVKNVFAIGDCVSGNPKFTHWADNEGQGIVRNIIAPFYKNSVRHRPLPQVMYTTLEVARVGFTQQEINQFYTADEIVTSTKYFKDNDRSYLTDKVEGFITVHYVRISGKIIGATIVAENAGEMLPQITYAIENNITAYKVLSNVYAYPTRSALFKRTALDFVARTFGNIKGEFLFWLKYNQFKIIALSLWVVIFAVYLYTKSHFGLTNAEIAQGLYNFIVGTIWGPIIYMVVYAIRPIILFPAGIMTFISGMIFGPIGGIVYTFLGENASASVAYWIGNKLGKTLVKPHNQGGFATIRRRLKGNDYISVLMLRLIPLNFDLVNYACGIFHVKYRPYVIATAFGIIPGMVTYVLAGASISNVDMFFKNLTLDSISLNGNYAIIAIALYIVSFALAFFLKRKYKDKL